MFGLYCSAIVILAQLQIRDHARVDGRALVLDWACIGGTAHVGGNVIVRGTSTLTQGSYIDEQEIFSSQERGW